MACTSRLHNVHFLLHPMPLPYSLFFSTTYLFKKNDGTDSFVRQKLRKNTPGIRGGNCCPPHKKKNLQMKPWQFGSRILQVEASCLAGNDGDGLFNGVDDGLMGF